MKKNDTEKIEKVGVRIALDVVDIFYNPTGVEESHCENIPLMKYIEVADILGGLYEDQIYRNNEEWKKHIEKLENKLADYEQELYEMDERIAQLEDERTFILANIDKRGITQ
jgi:hypothetical protein